MTSSFRSWEYINVGGARRQLEGKQKKRKPMNRGVAAIISTHVRPSLGNSTQLSNSVLFKLPFNLHLLRIQHRTGFFGERCGDMLPTNPSMGVFALHCSVDLVSECFCNGKAQEWSRG